MLFLVRIGLREPDPDEIGRLLELIENEWQVVGELVERGQVRACGKIADTAGAVAIFDMDDEAAVRGVVRELPLAPFFESVEVRRLVPPDQALRTARRRRHAYETIVARRGTRAQGSLFEAVTRA